MFGDSKHVCIGLVRANGDVEHGCVCMEGEEGGKLHTLSLCVLKASSFFLHCGSSPHAKLFGL